MSAAFVPTFTRHVAAAGRESGWRLGNHVINALLVITGSLVLVGMVFARPLVTALAAPYAAVTLEDGTNKLELTIVLARIMLPTLTLIAAAAALMGMLNSLRHFFIPAFSPAMFNVVTIVMAVTLIPLSPAIGLAQPIVIIALATVLGAAAQLALQWPTLRREGFVYRPTLDWGHSGLRRVLVLMGPGTVGLAATQLNVAINVFLAARQGTGAVAWLEYAFRIMYLPIGLFGVSIATAVLPAVSRHVVNRDTAASRATIADGLALMLMLNIPATLGLMVLAVPIVRVIFERGEFRSADTLATAGALRFYAVGLIAYSVVRIASPTFYALGRNRTPVVVSIVSVVVNLALNILLVRVIGYTGLALGTSLAAVFNAVVLLVLLRRHLGGLEERRVAGSLVRISLASVVMAAAAAGMDAWLGMALPGEGLPRQVLRLGLSIGVALFVLGGAAWALRIRELHDAAELILRRLRRAP